MGDVLPFPWLGNRTTDGGKDRIRARRAARNLVEPIHDWRDEDLTMDHVDTELDLRPSEIA